MTTYVALLRGINVGGHRRVPMADLRAALAGAGLQHVRTLIQSGNAVFAADGDRDPLRRRIEQAVAERFGFDVPVLLRTREEIERVLEANPWAGRTPDDMRVNVVFLASEPAAAAVREVESADGGPERVAVRGRELYHLRKPYYAQSIFTPAWLEKRLGVLTTARNLDVVARIGELMRAAPQ